jgi:hypothetical protein
VIDPRSSTPEPEDPAEQEEDEEHPLGTLFILMIFITVLAGMWGAMYLTLLGR